MKPNIFLLLLTLCTAQPTMQACIHSGVVDGYPQTYLQRSILHHIKALLGDPGLTYCPPIFDLYRLLCQGHRLPLGEKIQRRVHPYPRTLQTIRELNDPIEMYRLDEAVNNKFLFTRVFTRDARQISRIKELFLKRAGNGIVHKTIFFDIMYPQELTLLSKKMPVFDISTPIERHTIYYIDIVQR